MSKSSILELHGTRLNQLKPSSIVAAALSDLALKVRKKMERADDFAPYAFHRRHVQKAEGAAELISIAIHGLKTGQASGKRSKRLLYAKKELLIEAWVSIHAGDEHGAGRE